MPFELPNLDDRRFDDLVAEAKAHLSAHVPELTELVPGDPAVAFIDLFAFLTESICYRANLIPERQRRAFLNLLDVPLRPAQPARGVVCIDSALGTPELPPLLPDGTVLTGGKQVFTTVGELQPTPLALTTVVKTPVTQQELLAAGITEAQLASLHRALVAPFRPEPVTFPGSIALDATLDGALYLALTVAADLARNVSASDVRANLVGKTLSIAVAPVLDEVGTSAETSVPLRRLRVDVAYQAVDGLRYAPLTVLADSSEGARRAGVLRVRLPSQVGFLLPPHEPDPQFAGVGEAPPELPQAELEESLVCWLRITCPDDPRLRFGYLGVNGVEVIAQEWVRQRGVGVGDGNPDQVIELGHTAIDAESFELEVQTESGFERWTRVEHLAGASRSAKVFTLDPEAGIVRFGDGVRGYRPPAQRRIRATYRHGGGVAGNVGPNTITGLASGDPSYAPVRQELSLRGGMDGESVASAERRIGAFLRHRDRAVTADDFRALALEAPNVARAEVVPGLVPEMSDALARTDVPGAVSVFVLPPGEPGTGASPRPTVALLRDVHAHLKQRTLIGTELYVLSPAWRPLAVTVCLGVREPERERETLQDVERAVLEYLWALAPGGPRGEGWPLGYDVDPSELAAVVARVPNVLKIGSLALFVPDEGGGWSRVAPGTALSIDAYTLPELRGVLAIGSPDADPVPPGGSSTTNGKKAVPAPIIPDRC